MKKKNDKNIYRHALAAMLVLVSLMALSSCREEEKPMKWVDLRYKTEDTYLLEATNPLPITIQVKSTDPWEVFSKHKEWCTISPENGAPGEIFNVTITYKNNTGLDDRKDTVTIKSDYWIGKEVEITQKGTAFLFLEDDKDFLLGKDENSIRTFKIKSNQKWSAAVTGGGEWLSITSGNAGQMNGEVTVKCKANNGEKRYGKVVVYDRHGVNRAEVACTQDGVQLDPAKSILHADYPSVQVVLPVVSNTDWFVTKDDNDATWYSFEQTEFNGTKNLVIKIDENKSTSVRKTSFTLSTKLTPGTSPVIRTIILKQAYKAVPVHREFDNPIDWTVFNGTIAFASGDLTCTAGRVTRGGLAPGYYSFRIKSITSDAQSTLFFTYPPYGAYSTMEIRWHLNMATGKTNYSTAPYTSVVERNKSFDTSKKAYTLGLNLSRSDKAGMMKIEWFLDGVLMDSYDNNAGDIVYPYVNSFVYLGCSSGTVVYDWWEYTPPVDWGDE